MYSRSSCCFLLYYIYMFFLITLLSVIARTGLFCILTIEFCRSHFFRLTLDG
jgi:hypothetical protein